MKFLKPITTWVAAFCLAVGASLSMASLIISIVQVSGVAPTKALKHEYQVAMHDNQIAFDLGVKNDLVSQSQAIKVAQGNLNTVTNTREIGLKEAEQTLKGSNFNNKKDLETELENYQNLNNIYFNINLSTESTINNTLILARDAVLREGQATSAVNAIFNNFQASQELAEKTYNNTVEEVNFQYELDFESASASLAYAQKTYDSAREAVVGERKDLKDDADKRALFTYQQGLALAKDARKSFLKTLYVFDEELGKAQAVILDEDNGGVGAVAEHSFKNPGLTSNGLLFVWGTTFLFIGLSVVITKRIAFKNKESYEA